MKKIFMLAAILIMSKPLFAEKCQVKSVFNLSLFAMNSITGTNLLSEGSIAAGKNVNLNQSMISNTDCRAITSNGSLSLTDSRTEGSVEGLNKVNLLRTKIKGDVRSSQKVDLSFSEMEVLITPKGANMNQSIREKWWTSDVIQSMDQSKFKSDLIESSKKLLATAESHSVNNVIYKNSLTISLKNQINVLSLKGSELEKLKMLEIRGSDEQSLIINISGEKMVLDELRVDISGDLKLSNIIWNFFEAKSLSFKNTANSVVGIPGKIIAPSSNVYLENSLITGSLYADSIFLLNDQHSQISVEIRGF